MKVGIAVFAYNRNLHLSQTLAGLKTNKDVKEIYVFQDGLKMELHRSGWKATKKVISDIDWCEVNYILSDKNKGLAKSIVDGINHVLAENEAVIVLEDDCVPSPNFINFMHQCFEKYKNDKSVYSVSGYAWPIDIAKDQYDVYFTGRISSWGWGTWKDRWNKYEIDNQIVDRLKHDEKGSINLATWGNDLESMLKNRINGKNDSWAVYWALKVIEMNGKCVAPYESLINNIGCDGSGVHCGVTARFAKELDTSEEVRDFALPDVVKAGDKEVLAFASLYGSYTAVNNDTSKKKVLIYGFGNYFKANEKYINDNYYIKAFIDKAKEGYYAGKRIIKIEQINEYNYDAIVIMIQNIQESLNIAKKLRHECNVPIDKILIGGGVINRGYNKQSIVYTQDDKLKVSINGVSCKIGSLDEYNNVYEVLFNQTYNYYINNDKKDIVIDIGMNIGDATLYFLNKDNVRKVYGFEPFRQTFLSAKDNLKDYLSDEDRLEIFQFGISSRNEKREIIYNKEMSCGQSTIEKTTEFARDRYNQMGLIFRENDVLETIEVRRASEILQPIIEKHTQNNIVLKMDCEGDEYGIMKELMETKLLGKIDFLMLEWHYNGKEILLEYLKKNGFSYWCSDKSMEMGLIYAYKNTKNGLGSDWSCI